MISWTLTEGVYEIQLGREPCNEIGTTVLAELERFLDEVDTENASAVILYSSIKGGFSAGADLRELYQGLLDVPEKQHEPGLRAFIDRIHSVMDRLDMLPMTTIGVVHGVCFGGGFELALTCDLLIAEKNARFAFPELRLGLVPRVRRNPAFAARCLQRGRTRHPVDGTQHQRQEGGRLRARFADGARGGGAAGGSGHRRPVHQIRPGRGTNRETVHEASSSRSARRGKEHFIRLANRPFLKAALKKFVESDDVLPYLP